MPDPARPVFDKSLAEPLSTGSGCWSDRWSTDAMAITIGVDQEAEVQSSRIIAELVDMMYGHSVLGMIECRQMDDKPTKLCMHLDRRLMTCRDLTPVHGAVVRRMTSMGSLSYGGLRFIDVVNDDVYHSLHVLKGARIMCPLG